MSGLDCEVCKGRPLCRDIPCVSCTKTRPVEDSLGLTGQWVGNARIVSSEVVRARIESEGRWGFFVGLLTGLLIAGLVFLFGPP